MTPDTITSWVASLVAHYPILTTILLLIGALRVLFKPVMALLDSYVKSNYTPEQYGKFVSFEAGPVFKWVSFALDFLGSIKLSSIAAAHPATEPATDATAPAPKA